MRVPIEIDHCGLTIHVDSKITFCPLNAELQIDPKPLTQYQSPGELTLPIPCSCERAETDTCPFNNQWKGEIENL